jgi:hypothetical protein
MERIRQTKEMELGNLVVLAATFHAGIGDEKRRWREQYPALADQIAKTPESKMLRQVGSPFIAELPDELLVEQARLCRDKGLYFATPPISTSVAASNAAVFSQN